jgi:chemotaxis response regulator CheB
LFSKRKYSNYLIQQDLCRGLNCASVLRARNILIVDDSSSVRGALRSLIDTQDDLVVCGEAVDGLDAIAKARELKPDLILLDLAMAKLNGAATASILKRMMPQSIINSPIYDVRGRRAESRIARRRRRGVGKA